MRKVGASGPDGTGGGRQKPSGQGVRQGMLHARDVGLRHQGPRAFRQAGEGGEARQRGQRDGPADKAGLPDNRRDRGVASSTLLRRPHPFDHVRDVVDGRPRRVVPASMGEARARRWLSEADVVETIEVSEEDTARALSTGRVARERGPRVAAHGR